jgi:hypothetical protein
MNANAITGLKYADHLRDAVPPCIRQRPLGMAGDWQGVPFRVFAPHRGLWCMGNLFCMGLFIAFLTYPLLPCAQHGRLWPRVVSATSWISSSVRPTTGTGTIHTIGIITMTRKQRSTPRHFNSGRCENHTDSVRHSVLLAAAMGPFITFTAELGSALWWSNPAITPLVGKPRSTDPPGRGFL